MAIRAHVCCGSLSLPKPEEAMTVPIRSGHRLGDLGQAAEGLAIPGDAFLEDHDLLEIALPFAHEQRAGLQTQALARLGLAAIEWSADAILFPRAKDPSDRFVQIRTRRTAIDRPALSSTASAGDGQAVRRPSGCAIDGATH